jgi:acyl transferase domain-containing protein/acyl carrier protein
MNKSTEDTIAIIGMAGRFPGANNINEFWNNLMAGTETINRWHDNTAEHSNYVNAKGLLDGAEYFAADFFNIIPKTAQIMDPQFRLFIECVWEAWEDAGYIPNQLNSTVGVYACSGSLSSYFDKNLKRNKQFSEPAQEYELTIYNAKDFLATFVAYKFNFRGPCINIQTACSSSLVAICYACDDLIRHKCDAAVVGGMSVTFPLKEGYFFREGMIYSRDGYCRALAADANGVVPGNGGGVLILKRLSQAIKDGDHIYAIIQGYAINNDGNNKLSFTAPNIESQYEVLKIAAANAAVDPGALQYIEAHGTATPLGDQIEITALKEYLTSGILTPNCLLGSVKSNIGHLDVAAGIASVIKVALALKNEIIPPTLHVASSNPALENNSILSVVKKATPWPTTVTAYAGVSSFGVGGTNAHAILTKAPTLDMQYSDSEQLLIFSARDPEELISVKNNFVNYIKNKESFALADIAYTLQVGRCAFPYRACTVAGNEERCLDSLCYPGQRRLIMGESHYATARKCFVFGEQYSKTFAENCDRLKALFPLFTDEYQSCMDLIDRFIVENFIGNKSKQSLNLMAMQYALAKTYIALGFVPDSLLGYGVGEIVAASVAGIFDFSTVIRLTHKWFEGITHNANISALTILSDPTSLSALLNLNKESLQITIVQTHQRCVVVGNNDEINILRSELASKGIFFQHNEGIMIPFKPDAKFNEQWEQTIDSIQFNKNSLFKLQASGDPCTMEYWKSKIDNIQDFYSLAKDISQKDNLFMEIGDSNQCTFLLKQAADFNNSENLFLSCVQTNDANEYSPLIAIAKLWTAGIDINWPLLHKLGTRKRVSLPTYPFTRQRYWVEPDQLSTTVPVKKTDLKAWLYTPYWNYQPLKENTAKQYDAVVIIKDRQNLLEEVLNQLQKQLLDLSTIYSLQPASIATEIDLQNRIVEWESIFSALLKNKKVLIIYADFKNGYSNQFDNPKFYDFVALAKAIGKLSYQNEIKLIVVTDSDHPMVAMNIGAVLCLPLEHANIKAQYITLDYECDFLQITNELAKECLSDTQDRIVKLIAGKRHVKHYKQYNDNETKHPIKLKQNGYYLIAGGLSGIGLELADYLAENFQSNLILLTKSDFPKKNHWATLLKSESTNKKLNRKLQKLISLDNKANTLQVLSVDVTDKIKLVNILKRFPKIDGVIHAASAFPEGRIQYKKWDNIIDMLQTKIAGFTNLEDYFKNKNLDFIILCSALNTVQGAVGSMDYIAANAYMDAVAESITDTAHPVISIAWDAWEETGMYFNYKAKHASKLPFIYDENSLQLIETFPSMQWAMFAEEHRIDDNIVVPGALSLALFYQSFSKTKSDIPMEIKNFSFIKPGIIQKIDHTKIICAKTSEDKTNTYILYNDEQHWSAIACGKIIPSNEKANDIDVNFRVNDFLDQTNIPVDKFYEHPRVKLGACWDCLEWIKQKDKFYLAKISLPIDYTGQMQQLILHPVLLDVALSYYARLLKEHYLPLYVERIIIYQPLSTQLYSHVHIINNDEVNGICKTDIILLDLSYNIILKAEGFCLKKSAVVIESKAVNEGLTNNEGIEIFKLILERPAPYIVVSKYANYFDQIKPIMYDREQIQISAQVQQQPIETTNTATANTDTLINKIRAIWSDVLSIHNIKDNDDFFDLGGDSLFAIQACYKIKVSLAIDINPDVLLTHSKLKDFCQLISEKQAITA